MLKIKGNKLPDANIIVGALAGVLTKSVFIWAKSHGYTLIDDADVQGDISLLVFGLVAHLYDMISGDNISAPGPLSSVSGNDTGPKSPEK